MASNILIKVLGPNTNYRCLIKYGLL